MVKGFNLTPIDNLIINRICDIQIESHCRLAEKDTDKDLRKMGLSVSKSDVALELVSIIEIYEEVKSNKRKFILLDAAEISHIKDMILSFADEFRQEFSPKQVAEFWHKISILNHLHTHIN